MNRSESIAGLMKALCEAQKHFPAILKEAENPFYNSTYADLSMYVEATRAPLTDAGIAVSQDVETEFLAEPLAFELVEVDKFGKMKSLKGSTQIVVAVTTTLFFGEEFHGSTLRFPVVDPRPQVYASASTYARRYGFAAKVFAAAQDEDGNEASGRGRELVPDKDRDEYVAAKTAALKADIDKQNAAAAKAKLKKQLQDSVDQLVEAKKMDESKPQPDAKREDPGLISEAQLKMIWSIANKRGLSDGEVREAVGSIGYESLRGMPRSKVRPLLDLLDPDFKYHVREQPPQPPRNDGLKQ